MIKRRAGPVFLIIIGLAVLYGVLSSFQPTESVPTPDSSKPAPDIGVKTGSGQVKLSDLRGKVVLLDFWATWCGPCRMSIPGIERLYEQKKARGFEVLGISKDDQARPA